MLSIVALLACTTPALSGEDMGRRYMGTTATSMMQLHSPRRLSDASAFVASAPPSDVLSKDPTKMKEFAVGLFGNVDTNKDGSIDRNEMTQGLLAWKEDGIIGRLPTNEEARKIEELAGEDLELQPDEFEGVIAKTVQALATEPQVSNGEKEMSSATAYYVANVPSIKQVSTATGMDPLQMKLFSDGLYKEVDVNKDGSVQRDEMVWFFVDLKNHGVLSRMPNDEEVEKMEGMAGEDMELDTKQFEAIVTKIVPTMVA